MLAINLILTCAVGVLWFVLSLYVAAHMKATRRYWPRSASFAVGFLGFLAGAYRMEYAAWVYLNTPAHTFLSTEVALLTNIFTLADGAILLYYVRAALKKREGA